MHATLRRATSRASRTRSASSASRSLAKGPRLPAPRQRRLDQLLHKGQDGSLTKKESAELEGMLDEIDRKSFWMLARALVEKRNSAAPRTAGRKPQLGVE